MNLDRGVANVSGYKKLLLHYRQLSSLLDEAPSIETRADIDGKIVTKTSHPITQKTDRQKDMLMQQAIVELDRENHGNGYHTKSNVAIQEANRVFLELMCDDTRRLSEQTRKTHLPTVKNGYIETVDIDGSTLTYVCAGTIAYVESHASSDERIAAGKENIRQILMAASQHSELKDSTDLHFQILNTRLLGIEKQDIMVDVTKGATQGKIYIMPDKKQVKTHYSNTPVNELGKFCLNNIDSDVAKAMGDDYSKWTTWMPNPLSRSTRNQVAINASYAAATTPDLVHIISCASARDRTRVIGAGITEKHLIANGLSKEDAQLFEPLTQNNGFTAHLANCSGYGQKSCSNPKLQANPEQIFLETADKNKQAKLNAKLVKKVTKSQVLGYDYLVDVIARVREEQRHRYGFFKELFFDKRLGEIQKTILADLVTLLENVHNGEKLPAEIAQQFNNRDQVTINEIIDAWKNQNITQKMAGAEKTQSNLTWLSQHRNSFFGFYLNGEHTHEIDALNTIQSRQSVNKVVSIKC